MPTATAADIERLPLLSDLTPADLEAFAASVDIVEAPAGTSLIRRGQVGPGLHLLLQGQVSVVVHAEDHDVEVAVLAPSTFFGEMSLLDDVPAQADVTALSDVRLAVLPPSRIDALDLGAGLREELADTARRRRASNRVTSVSPVVAPRTDLELALRPLWPDDWRLMQSSLLRTSQDSLRRRFFSVPNLTEHTLRRLARVDWVDHFAWAVLEDAGRGELVGIGRYGRHVGQRDDAELALIVTDDLQGRGIGRLLVGALAVAADAHGVVNFTATALADNLPVQGLLTRFGATWQPGDRGQEVEATWSVALALAQTPPELREALTPVVEAVLAPS